MNSELINLLKQQYDNDGIVLQWDGDELSGYWVNEEVRRDLAAHFIQGDYDFEVGWEKLRAKCVKGNEGWVEYDWGLRKKAESLVTTLPEWQELISYAEKQRTAEGEERAAENSKSLRNALIPEDL